LEPSRPPLPIVSRHYFGASDGARLAYYLAGNRDGPPLLISAGLGGGIRGWSAVIGQLQEQFRIIAWDYRGLYASAVPGAPPAPEELTIARHARDLAELIDHLDLHREERPILAGWSMGVQVMFELGRTRPHAARAMIALHGAPGRILSTAFDSERFSQMAPQIFDLLRTYGDALKGPARQLARSRAFAVGFMRVAQRLGIMNEEADPDIFHDMAKDWLLLDLETYGHMFEQLGRHDATDVLPHLDIPTLVIAGGDDPFTPAHLSVEIARLLPDAKLVVLPGATHFGPLEFPDEIVDAILRFSVKRDLLTDGYERHIDL
jgi:pimeloyl-ACP methyl ester carboxylesterase